MNVSALLPNLLNRADLMAAYLHDWAGKLERLSGAEAAAIPSAVLRDAITQMDALRGQLDALMASVAAHLPVQPAATVSKPSFEEIERARVEQELAMAWDDPRRSVTYGPVKPAGGHGFPDASVRRMP